MSPQLSTKGQCPVPVGLASSGRRDKPGDPHTQQEVEILLHTNQFMTRWSHLRVVRGGAGGHPGCRTATAKVLGEGRGAPGAAGKFQDGEHEGAGSWEPVGGRGWGGVRDGGNEMGSAGDGQTSLLHFTEEETEGQGGPETVPCDGADRLTRIESQPGISTCFPDHCAPLPPPPPLSLGP